VRDRCEDLGAALPNLWKNRVKARVSVYRGGDGRIGAPNDRDVSEVNYRARIA